MNNNGGECEREREVRLWRGREEDDAIRVL